MANARRIRPRFDLNVSAAKAKTPNGPIHIRSSAAEFPAVVATVTVRLVGAFPATVTLAGVTVQVDFGGHPAMESVTLPTYPLTALAASEYVAVDPATTLSGAMPVMQ